MLSLLEGEEGDNHKRKKEKRCVKIKKDDRLQRRASQCPDWGMRQNESPQPGLGLAGAILSRAGVLYIIKKKRRKISSL